MVLRDLHSKGLHFTSGLKFGTDYLVYKGDPSVFHSEWMLKVVTQPDIATDQLVALERVANTSKKTLVLAFSDGDKPSYVELKWTSEKGVSG